MLHVQESQFFFINLLMFNKTFNETKTYSATWGFFILFHLRVIHAATHEALNVRNCVWSIADDTLFSSGAYRLSKNKTYFKVQWHLNNSIKNNNLN